MTSDLDQHAGMELASAEPLRGMRRTIARRMRASLHDMAQLTLHRNLEADALLAWRDELRRDGRTLNDAILAAVVRCLAEFPALNARLEDDTVYRWNTVNLGVAVAVEDGLMVPVIKDAQRLDLHGLGAESRRLSGRAQDGSIAPEEMTGGTFTVTNLGAFGVDGFTPIVNPPEVGILGVGAVRARGLTLSLTIDHRALDGVIGARFLDRLATMLESPAELDLLLGASGDGGRAG
jgi:pyruvate dehydrogenase E2 component (dihydrolipoamide acetyltransferase)